MATLLIEGPELLRAAENLLCVKGGKKLSDCPANRPIYARFGGEKGEEIIVRRRGGALRQIESLEIHCHGGCAAVHEIENAFAERGFSRISWKDWIANNAADPFAAAARLALADARTERTAAILLDQYHGALRRAFEKIERSSGVSRFSCPPQALMRRQSQIDALLERAPLGLHLTQPWRVTLIGAPNVGKSSLLNALAGYNRAIVHHTPGTTRDLVTVHTAFEGWPVELCDTAGLRTLRHADDKTENDDLERAGIELAREQIAQADLLLLIFDAVKSWTPADQTFRERYPQALVLHNKADLPRSVDNRPEGLFVSAMTGQGIEKLPHLIARRLVPQPPPPGAAVPFTKEQIEKLLVGSCRERK